jgi:2-keto-4-pentenoate hydratase
LLDLLEGQIAGTLPARDLLDESPDLSIDDAYRLQFALMRRRVKQGDRIIGYKAAYTTTAMQNAYGVSGPSIGTLLKSLMLSEHQAIRISASGKTSIEAEIAALLKHDLEGPGLTGHDVVRAIEGFLPSLEIAPPSIGGARRSRQMGVAVHKSNIGVIIGGPLTSPRGFDLRLEGAMVSINGQARGSGTAVEALGSPLNVIAYVGNLLANHGEKLHAGMIVMTGSVVPAVQVYPHDNVVVEFNKLGRVRARFASIEERADASGQAGAS